MTTIAEMKRLVALEIRRPFRFQKYSRGTMKLLEIHDSFSEPIPFEVRILETELKCIRRDGNLWLRICFVVDADAMGSHFNQNKRVCFNALGLRRSFSLDGAMSILQVGRFFFFKNCFPIYDFPFDAFNLIDGYGLSIIDDDGEFIESALIEEQKRTRERMINRSSLTLARLSHANL